MSLHATGMGAAATFLFGDSTWERFLVTGGRFTTCFRHFHRTLDRSRCYLGAIRYTSGWG